MAKDTAIKGTTSATAKGRTLYVYSSNIRTGQFEDFQKWIGENLERFAASQPPTWTLKDIYLTAFGLGTAHVEVHWEIEGYAALDVARDTARKKGPYFELLTRMHSFLDPATGRGRVLKSATSLDTLIVGC